MAFATAAQYFDSDEAAWRMQSDLGRKGTMPLELIEPAKQFFFLDAGPIPWNDTITSIYFENSRWWITACFFLTPLLSLWLLLRTPGSRVSVRILSLIALCLFLTQFLFSPIISFRYLQPFCPLLLMLAANFVDATFSNSRTNEHRYA